MASAASDWQFVRCHRVALRRLDPASSWLDWPSWFTGDSGWDPFWRIALVGWLLLITAVSGLFLAGLLARNLLLCSPSACWWELLFALLATRAVHSGTTQADRRRELTLAPSAGRPARNQRLGELLGECCGWGAVGNSARCRSGPWWSRRFSRTGPQTAPPFAVSP